VTTKDQIDRVMEAVRSRLDVRLHQKGWGCFISTHEAFGAIAEEWAELENAVKENSKSFDHETMDVLVACLFTLVSRKSGGMEW
jgi:hypothetical protein